METYILKYGIYYSGGGYSSHTTKVKKCMSELHAKSKLEDWLKKKHPNFESLVVHSAQRDCLGGMGSVFEDIFGYNPFNK